MGKTSDPVTRKCTSCDQEKRRDVTSQVRREPQQRSLKSFFAPSVATKAVGSVDNPAAVASPSDIRPGPSDIDSGASSALRLLEEKDCFDETVGTPFQPCTQTMICSVALRPCGRHDLSCEIVETSSHFWMDSVSEKDTLRPLERNELSGEISVTFSLSFPFKSRCIERSS